MEVDDAGRRAVKASHAPRMWLELAYALSVETAQPVHAVERAPSLELLQPRDLLGARGEDQLAAALVRDLMLFAIAVELRRSLHAQARLGRAGLVVDARVDDAGVVAGLVLTQLGLTLQYAYR